MIDIEGLSRTYGADLAVDALTVTVPAGCIVGLLGVNGAGKTTTLNMLATLLPPTAGTARVLGHDIRQEPMTVRRLLGYVPEHAALYEGLTAREYLELAGEIHRLNKDTIHRRMTGLMAHLELTGVQDRKLGTFSKGMRAKILMAAAVMHRPQVLLLDEPLNGLDVPSQRMLASLLRSMAAEGRTILYSSHILEQAQDLCGHVLLIHNGHLVYTGTVTALRAAHGGNSLGDILLHLTDSPPPDPGGLDALLGDRGD